MAPYNGSAPSSNRLLNRHRGGIKDHFGYTTVFQVCALSQILYNKKLLTDTKLKLGPFVSI